MMTLNEAVDLARAHGLAIRQIPGIRVAEIFIRLDGALLGETFHSCIGYCQKCDSYWQVFRSSKDVVIEVIDVGYSEPPSPTESVEGTSVPKPTPPGFGHPVPWKTK